MSESLAIGTVPCEEVCPQVGHCDPLVMRKVAEIYRNQLVRWSDEKGLEVCFTIKSSNHDFGTYYEVYAKITGDDEKAWEDACTVESEGPTEWDNIAKQELKAVWPEGLLENEHN